MELPRRIEFCPQFERLIIFARLTPKSGDRAKKIGHKEWHEFYYINAGTTGYCHISRRDLIQLIELMGTELLTHPVIGGTGS